jgi:glycosyltransferase involved in cell wall biosynthesis
VRLLFLNHNVAWSGTFFRAFHLARQLVGRGHAVTLVTTHRSARWSVREELRDGVRLLQMPDLWWGPARTGWDPWNALRRVLALRSEPFDVIHAFDSRPAVIVPALAVQSRGGGALFTDWADWWGRGGTIQERSGWPVRTFFGPVETWFEEAFRRRAVGTTVISEALAHRAIALGIEPGRVRVVPQGCDAERLVPRDRAAARAELGMGSDAMLLVHLGAMFRRDAALLFEAVRIARSDGLPVRLALVGNAKVRVPGDLGREACQVTGFVSFREMQSWLGAADACVVPLCDSIANRGRWPSKINDYLCAGRAVVATLVGDAARCVQDEGAGWVCGATAPALAEAMGQVFADPVRRQAAGARARSVAEGRLAWSTLAAEVEPFYRQGLDR